MWVAIVGSREFARCACAHQRDEPEAKHARGCRYPDHFRLVSRTVVKLKAEHGDRLDGIVSGAAKGADTAARIAAEAWGVRCEEFPVTSEDWKAHPKTAGFLRNSKIVAHASILIAFYAPGPLSSGTQDSVSKAIATGLATYAYHEGHWEMWNVTGNPSHPTHTVHA